VLTSKSSFIDAYSPLGSDFAPLATIFSISAGNGRCNSNAIGAGAVNQVSISSRVVRIAGMPSNEPVSQRRSVPQLETQRANVPRQPGLPSCRASRAMCPKSPQKRMAADRHQVRTRSTLSCLLPGRAQCSVRRMTLPARRIGFRVLAIGASAENLDCGYWSRPDQSDL